MATFAYNPDRLVSCPYDKAHRMLQSRMQTHIAKCKLNNLDKEMATCSFNAQHVVLAKDLKHHLVSCPDRILLEKSLVRNPEENEFSKGRTAVPAYTGPVLQSSENWDDEIDPNGTPGYTPKDPAASAGLILDLGMTKPAERKKIYNQAHQVAENNNSSFDDVLGRGMRSVYVRQPRFSHELVNTKSSGIGRGQSVAAPAPNVAANIYATTRQPTSSHSEINQLMARVGIGRGRPVKYDADFPVLGSH